MCMVGPSGERTSLLLCLPCPVCPAAGSPGTENIHAKGSILMSKLKRIVGLHVTTLLALICALLPAAVRADEAGKTKPHVVLVGISDYADKQIKPRPKAEDDAKALYDLFTNKDHLGVDAKNIRLLLGKADEKRNSVEATHKNILDAIKW